VTLLFFCLPSFVVFSPTGRVSPYPLLEIGGKIGLGWLLNWSRYKTFKHKNNLKINSFLLLEFRGLSKRGIDLQNGSPWT